MRGLKEKLAKQIPVLRKQARELIKKHGDEVISQVTVSQLFGGMRGVKGLVCDTSVVDADQGLAIRGIPIGKLACRLPEEIFYLLCTGELPDAKSLASLQSELRQRAPVSPYVWRVLETMPEGSHPMTLLSTAILVMERESVFRRRYAEGMSKDDYWEATLEDSLQLLAKLPAVAAGIYRLYTRRGAPLPSDPRLDWAADYAQMLGLTDPNGEFAKLMRLYLTLHCDHEGGNISAFTCHTVGSALSDAYYAVSAGINGLAGPLHGLAHQEWIMFALGVRKSFGGVPTDEQLQEYAWKTLQQGRVMPGYGHADIQVTDPRFTALLQFGERVCADDEIFRIVERIFAIAPGILHEQGNATDPWSRVDAISGALLYCFGLTEFDYYTVLFGVSRALGLCAQLVLNRALGTPITRPKSVSTEWIKANMAAAQTAA